MSYDRIDRFLRNNLGDDDYAEYSAALDSLCTPQRKPLTDEQIGNLDTWLVDQPFWRVVAFARAIETAHGIKENT